MGAVFMTACYLALGAVGYLKLGSNFDLSRPITSVLPYDAWSVTMNGLLFLHCVVAYAVSPQSSRQAVCVCVCGHVRVRLPLVLHRLCSMPGPLVSLSLDISQVGRPVWEGRN